jgi:hypothetical protein
MSYFELQCALGEDRFCIEVPAECSVDDVLKKASERSEAPGVSVQYSDTPLDPDHLFDDYFEP